MSPRGHYLRKPTGQGFCIRIPFAQRFWLKVHIPRHANEAPDFDACWPWIPAHRTGTQGLTGELRLPSPSKRKIKAPRAAILLGDPFSTQLTADEDLDTANQEYRHLDAAHSCDNPACCNPFHLSWQPHKANIHDFIYKYKHFRKGVKELANDVN